MCPEVVITDRVKGNRIPRNPIGEILNLMSVSATFGNLVPVLRLPVYGQQRYSLISIHLAES